MGPVVATLVILSDRPLTSACMTIRSRLVVHMACHWPHRETRPSIIMSHSSKALGDNFDRRSSKTRQRSYKRNKIQLRKRNVGYLASRYSKDNQNQKPEPPEI